MTASLSARAVQSGTLGQVETGTKSFIFEEAFTPFQCLVCRRRLGEHTPYTYLEGRPLCIPCYHKIEAQKKQKSIFKQI